MESVSPQIGKANRVFIGLVVMQHGVKYCIPLSHPKDKHYRMANNAELHKIVVENKLIGILNFNLMIPVTEKQLVSVDLKEHKNDTTAMKAWKRLCIKELKWCRKPENEMIIRDKARNLLLLYNSDQNFKGKSRCVIFLNWKKSVHDITKNFSTY